MLDKIESLSPDAFILDLEDSVSFQSKKQARNNIADRLRELEKDKKNIFVRINDINTDYVYDDIDVTISDRLTGYVVPKFEDAVKLKEVLDYISKKENQINLQPKVLKIILMVESSKGLLELNKINKLSSRIIAISLGAEDYLLSLTESKEVSDEMIDFARKIIITHSKANDLLSIDTVYRDYRDGKGLKEEVVSVAALGFTSKFAIHPDQISIINSAFSPTKKDLDMAEKILKNKKELEKKGAISIDGVMYDLPHLKWAQKIIRYLDKI